MDPLASPSATESQPTTDTTQLATAERPTKHTNVYNDLKKQPNRAQRNIDELFQRQIVFDNDRFNVLSAEWVADDDQAFTSVESPFFQEADFLYQCFWVHTICGYYS
ncbi:uncharacterized protein BX664DRAFT_310231 [Halteromyces radiatus]|uniref:uncharacterized protein n=1 Tax=Halteromyces radiatus TaxID=101107 RepID=UPI002220D7A2|nr:uncharacterized protein BX664DRAFT_310231 [Halteromyces radiatus]KAI8099238.1 hypothetical protein BX664DRAFT_310231 [Halteromyces radiatus]